MSIRPLERAPLGCGTLHHKSIGHDTAKPALSALTAFGLFAVAAMLVFYALEAMSHWFILAFAVACCLGSLYGFLQGAWPFGAVEAIWATVALRRWIRRRSATPG